MRQHISGIALCLAAALPLLAASDSENATSVLGSRSIGVPDEFVTSSDGTLIGIHEFGPRSGKTILFIHGFSHNSAVWWNQLSSLALLPFHVVMMDMRGHGYSGKPTAPSAYADSGLYADDVQAVITSLHLNKPVLAGWSMGGFVALEYLQKYGESAISGLDLVDSAACPDIACLAIVQGGPAQFQAFGNLAAPDAATEFLGIQQFVNLESSGSETNGTALTPSQTLILQEIMTSTPQFSRLGILVGLGSLNLILGNVMASLNVPVLIQHGSNDPLVPLSVVTVEQKLIRHPTVKLYPNTGHIPFVLAADAFNRDLARWMLTEVR